ncbi:MAG: hypothetical protein KKC28_12750, partial [Verrucomicrobia bacterium]|nr:hypothetical protein [Verrucomicrobiota bacterium]
DFGVSIFYSHLNPLDITLGCLHEGRRRKDCHQTSYWGWSCEGDTLPPLFFVVLSCANEEYRLILLFKKQGYLRHYHTMIAIA